MINALCERIRKLFVTVAGLLGKLGNAYFRTMSDAKEALKDAVQTESLSAQGPTFRSTPARRPSEQERKEFLESDNQIETVEEYRVSCRKCQCWVDLGHASYGTGNWVKHKVRCSAAMYVLSFIFEFTNLIDFNLQAEQSRGSRKT